MEHASVAEAGVIGKPDPVAGELVKAFVSVKPGSEATDELRLELIAFGRRGGGGFASLVLGSVSNQVVHHASCPVVVVPAGT